MSTEPEEHLTDPLDVASRNAQLFADSAIEARRRKLARVRNPVKPKNPDGTWPEGAWPEPDCDDCGEEIDVQRLECTGSNLCIHCATLRERTLGGR